MEWSYNGSSNDTKKNGVLKWASLCLVHVWEYAVRCRMGVLTPEAGKSSGTHSYSNLVRLAVENP